MWPSSARAIVARFAVPPLPTSPGFTRRRHRQCPCCERRAGNKRMRPLCKKAGAPRSAASPNEAPTRRVARLANCEAVPGGPRCPALIIPKVLRSAATARTGAGANAAEHCPSCESGQAQPVPGDGALCQSSAGTARRRGCGSSPTRLPVASSATGEQSRATSFGGGARAGSIAGPFGGAGRGQGPPCPSLQ